MIVLVSLFIVAFFYAGYWCDRDLKRQAVVAAQRAKLYDVSNYDLFAERADPNTSFERLDELDYEISRRFPD